MLLGRVITATIAGGIADPSYFARQPEIYAYGMICALFVGFVWQGFASYMGYNVSATHSISECSKTFSGLDRHQSLHVCVCGWCGSVVVVKAVASQTPSKALDLSAPDTPLAPCYHHHPPVIIIHPGSRRHHGLCPGVWWQGRRQVGRA